MWSGPSKGVVWWIFWETFVTRWEARVRIPTRRRGWRNTCQIGLRKISVRRVLIVLRLMRLLCLMGISGLILTWALVLIGVSRGLRLILILIRILTGIINRLSGNIIIIAIWANRPLLRPPLRPPRLKFWPLLPPPPRPAPELTYLLTPL